MKKSFSQNGIQKKNRGVAVIFTLGILGLLTVIALGFASTALLNRKIADNTASQSYARHIAQNIALARAKWAVMNNGIANMVYSTEITGDPTNEDFLHKMDTVLDGVEIFRITNDSGGIQNTARWQYIKDPNDSNRILGRYAYAVVSASGHLDTTANLGNSSVSGRYGFSEKELALPGDWNTALTTAAGSLGTDRWRSFYEIMQGLSISAAATKRTFFTDGIGIRQQPSPEAFWLDLNNDGKKTTDELFLRFNMPATSTAWESMTVDTLTGEGAAETDNDIKYSGSNNSVSFIPWLKYWETGVNPTWTNTVMKKQIAANILQYNLPGPTETSGGNPKQITFSDQSGDWLTNTPTYAGIGRHPMLNEIGFMVTVSAELQTVNTGSPESPVYQYTPTYKITVESGAELICPFFNPTTATDDIKKSFVKFAGEVILKMQKFKTQSEIDAIGSFSGTLDEIVDSEGWNLSSKSAQTVGSTTWSAVDLSLEFDVNNGTNDYWNASPAYTKAEKFWKEQVEQTITLPSFTLPGALNGVDKSADIKKLLKLRQVDYKPGNTVLRYGTDDSKYQRDFAKLPDQSDTTEKEIENKKWVYYISYQTKDPLVNHYESDWTYSEVSPKTAQLEYPTAGTPEQIAKDINKAYPGSVFDADGGSSDTDGCHLNKTLSGALLTDTENGSTTVSLEPATDPAYRTDKRLSSSYIRHEPMKSFWELGFISRAEAFKTLNLGRTRVFPSGTAYNARGGGTFAQGDANLLDQIKFSDTADQKNAYGKVNLNARYHKVFERLFNTDGTTAVTWRSNLISSAAATDPYNATAVSGDSSKLVCENTSGNCLTEFHSDSCTVDNCLAHLLLERSLILPFSNRSDLLLDPDTTTSTFDNIPGYSSLSSTLQTKLKTLQRKLRSYLFDPFALDSEDAKSKLVREQYATRFMNLLKTDPAEEHVYIIVLAQSIRDVGGAPAFVDWDGDGEYSNSSKDFAANAKYLKTGYVRKKLYEDAYETVGTVSSANETITTTAVGTYDYGADKITGEAKIVMEMMRDVITGKWKVVGYRYVE